MPSPNSQQGCPIPCNPRVGAIQGPSKAILPIHLSHRQAEEVILQHIQLRGDIHLHIHPRQATGRHRVLAGLAILRTLPKEVEVATLLIHLQLGEGIPSHSQLADRTA